MKAKPILLISAILILLTTLVVGAVQAQPPVYPIESDPAVALSLIHI